MLDVLDVYLGYISLKVRICLLYRGEDTTDHS